MVRIAVRQTDDGRFEAEGVVFEPYYDTMALGHATTSAIFGKIFARALATATPEEKQYFQLTRGLLPDDLFFKACDCGAFYLDARSNKHRGERRCGACFARQRYVYVQRSRARRRRGASLACLRCGVAMAGRSDRKFCSSACRTAAHRSRLGP
jgi:hypothetical protein